MKKIMMSETAQLIINVVIGLWVLIGMVVMFIAPSTMWEEVIAYPISVLVSVIVFLTYNVWISNALNADR